MADNTWGTRYTFLNGGTQPSLIMMTGMDGQKLVSDLNKIRDNLGKMAAVRPSNAVADANTIVAQSIERINQILNSQPSSNNKPDDVSEGNNRGPSL